LYPNKDQQILLAKHFGCCRWVYNWALAEKIKAWENGKYLLSRYELSAQLPSMKDLEATSWLGEVNAQSLQQELVCLEMSYSKFFKEKKGFPNFKSRHGRQRFICPQHVTFNGAALAFPKLGSIVAVIDRQFIGKIKTVVVSKVPSGKYFASVLVDNGIALPTAKKHMAKTTIGIDLGLKDFAALSTGEKVKNPRHLKQDLARLKREQRRLSRKKRGSNNRNKQRVRVAKVHERIANRRNDFLHKLSTRLIRENQALAFETLSVSGMLKNRKLARHIADVGWRTFIDFCKYKASWYGKTILEIGPFMPSSRLCTCGVINHELTLADRTWTCKSCGATHDRDILAAQNIKRMALHPKNYVRLGKPELMPVEAVNG